MNGYGEINPATGGKWLHRDRPKKKPAKGEVVHQADAAVVKLLRDQMNAQAKKHTEEVQAISRQLEQVLAALAKKNAPEPVAGDEPTHVRKPRRSKKKTAEE